MRDVQTDEDLAEEKREWESRLHFVLDGDVGPSSLDPENPSWIDLSDDVQ